MKILNRNNLAQLICDGMYTDGLNLDELNSFGTSTLTIFQLQH